MNVSEIKVLQRHIGAEPDGFWGPKSIAACQRHLRSLMPSPNPWPASDEKSIRARFGPPGEDRLVNLPVIGLGVEYLGKPVRTIRCHELVRDSLLDVISDIANGPHEHVLKRYAGCFNHRPMRNGSSLSTHSWGIAIDLWPARNGNAVHWPTRAEMPIGVMESFARQGWLAAGAFWSRDAMHFQSTR